MSCYVSGTGNIHVLLRTTNINPFDETWTWGNLNLIGHVDVEVQAYLSGTRTIGPSRVFPRMGIPGLFVGVRVAGIEAYLGVLADLWWGALATFGATATLTYQRTMSLIRTLAHHTRQGQTILYSVDGFNPSAQQDSQTTPQLRLEIDATARVYVSPQFYVGIYLTASTWAQAEVYAKVEVQLSLSAQFNFRTALGTSYYFPARNAALVTPLPLLPPIPFLLCVNTCNLASNG